MVSVIVSGTVGVTGVALPAITTAITKRGDRRHEATMLELQRRTAATDQRANERTTAYLATITAFIGVHEHLDYQSQIPRPEVDINRYATSEIRGALHAWGSPRVVEAEGNAYAAALDWARGIEGGARSAAEVKTFVERRLDLENAIRAEISAPGGG
jgi:hypothetical protein